jgi:hypothetical protein
VSVDAEAIAETWGLVDHLKMPLDAEICVFLMGPKVARRRASSRTRSRTGAEEPSRGRTVVVIPVDARNWDAHTPTDAPAVARTLLARLKTGA